MNVAQVSWEKVFCSPRAYTMIDVRSPAEFARGHVPDAHNIPLFSDQLRALVGTIYVREGRERAFSFALQEVGPNLHELVAQARAVYTDKTLAVYCARGGMRSASVAWLFGMSQLPVCVVSGGYKSFRNWVIKQFETPKNLKVLAGKTGAGKTEFLRVRAGLGEPVIDLELLARHKGSVFGGQRSTQATQQQFENDLAVQWTNLDSEKPVWIEDESRKIGAVIIPEPIWELMKTAPVYLKTCTREERITRIMAEYGVLDKNFLLHALESIKQPLGLELYQRAHELVCAGELVLAVDLLLDYYDRLYEHNRAHKNIVGEV